MSSAVDAGRAFAQAYAAAQTHSLQKERQDIELGLRLEQEALKRLEAGHDPESIAKWLDKLSPIAAEAFRGNPRYNEQVRVNRARDQSMAGTVRGKDHLGGAFASSNPSSKFELSGQSDRVGANMAVNSPLPFTNRLPPGAEPQFVGPHSTIVPSIPVPSMTPGVADQSIQGGQPAPQQVPQGHPGIQEQQIQGGQPVAPAQHPGIQEQQIERGRAMMNPQQQAAPAQQQVPTRQSTALERSIRKRNTAREAAESQVANVETHKARLSEKLASGAELSETEWGALFSPQHGQVKARQRAGDLAEKQFDFSSRNYDKEVLRDLLPTMAANGMNGLQMQNITDTVMGEGKFNPNLFPGAGPDMTGLMSDFTGRLKSARKRREQGMDAVSSAVRTRAHAIQQGMDPEAASGVARVQLAQGNTEILGGVAEDLFVTHTMNSVTGGTPLIAMDEDGSPAIIDGQLVLTDPGKARLQAAASVMGVMTKDGNVKTVANLIGEDEIDDGLATIKAPIGETGFEIVFDPLKQTINIMTSADAAALKAERDAAGVGEDPEPAPEPAPHEEPVLEETGGKPLSEGGKGRFENKAQRTLRIQQRRHKATLDSVTNALTKSLKINSVDKMLERAAELGSSDPDEVILMLRREAPSNLEWGVGFDRAMDEFPRQTRNILRAAIEAKLNLKKIEQKSKK